MAKKELDAKTLLAQIEMEEATAFAAFEEKQKEARERKLAGVLNPIRKELEAQKKIRDEAEVLIDSLQKQIDGITGQTTKKPKGKGAPRTRWTDEQKTTMAQKLYDHLKKKGDEVEAGELNKLIPSDAPSNLKTAGAVQKYWNSSNKDKQIKWNGQKRNSRYSLA